MSPVKKRAKPKPERHRWFDQWVIAKGEPLHLLVEAVLRSLERDEMQRGLRHRARRAGDLTNFWASVNAAVSNLAYAVLMPPETGRIAVKLGGQRSGMTRYENPALGSKPFRKLINQLSELDVLSLNRSKRRGEVSSIAPSHWFVGQVQKHSITLADFGRAEDEEVIVLSRNTSLIGPDDTRITKRERIDYKDTKATRSYRSELRRLNSFLASADISFVEDNIAPRIDPFDRTLRRHFVIRPKQPERFDQGGRFFGGFWLGLKAERRKNIRINGEPVADLDFGTMFTRLAYARMGVRPPKGDLYAVAGTEGYRSGVKMAMNTFLFDSHNRRSKWPSEMGVGVGNDADASDKSSDASEFEARLPAGWTVGRTRKAILELHPALQKVWGRGLGYELMFDESRILLLALTRLMEKNIPALGMHDGLLVQRSSKATAKTIMKVAAREIAGVGIPVEEKG